LFKSESNSKLREISILFPQQETEKNDTQKRPHLLTIVVKTINHSTSAHLLYELEFYSFLISECDGDTVRRKN